MNDESMNGMNSVRTAEGQGFGRHAQTSHEPPTMRGSGLAALVRPGRISLALAAAIALAFLVAMPSAAMMAPAGQDAPPAATPTLTPDERLRERQLDKLTFEIRVLQQQEESLRQERVVGEWRAIASTLVEFGQLAIGLGLLVVLARGLERWLGRDEKLSQRYVDEEREVERGI